MPVAALADEAADAVSSQPEAAVQAVTEAEQGDKDVAAPAEEAAAEGETPSEEDGKDAVAPTNAEATTEAGAAADKPEDKGEVSATAKETPAGETVATDGEDGDEDVESTEPTVGWVKDGLTWQYLDDAGAAKTGWFDWEGHWYLFDANGQMLTGWQEVSGVRYYLYASGVLAQGDWVAGTGQPTYLGDSGAPASGLTETPRGTYYLNDGLGDGSQRLRIINSKLYRFESSGAAASSLTGTGNTQLDQIVEKIILTKTGIGSDAAEKAYDYVRQNYSYAHMDTWPAQETWETWSQDYAIHMYTAGSGNCYRYACLLTWILRTLGYDAIVRVGWVPGYGGKIPHGWCEVTLANGAKRVVDCSMARNDMWPQMDWYMNTYKRTGSDPAHIIYYDYNNVEIATYA